MGEDEDGDGDAREGDRRARDGGKDARKYVWSIRRARGIVARHRARHRARVRSASVSPPHRPTASRFKNLNGRAMDFLVDF